MRSDAALLLLAGAGIVVLLVLIIRARLEPFVALLLVAATVAIAAGIPLDKVVPTMEDGVGTVLGHVAPIVGLGAMLGKMLELSGGAQRLADRLLGLFGEHRAPLALGLTGLIFGIPVFFDVGVIVLAPVVYAAAVRGGGARSMLYYCLPLAGGLAIVHGVLPPHPGAVAAAGLLHVGLGYVIVFGLACAIPAWVLGGLLYSRWIADRIYVPLPEHAAESFHDDFLEGARPLGEPAVPPTVAADDRSAGGGGTAVLTRPAAAVRTPAAAPAPQVALGTVLAIVVLPLALILLQTFSTMVISDEHSDIRRALSFFGAPMTALVTAVLAAFYVLGIRRGWSREHLVTVAESALKPVGMILLVVGAGAAFGNVLLQSGVGTVLSDQLSNTGLPLIVLAFAIALGLRVAQGSATVAIVGASGIVGPIVERAHLSEPRAALIVVALGAGRHRRVACQRRRLLDGQSPLRDRRAGHAQVLDGHGDHPGLRRVRHGGRPQPRRLTRNRTRT
jgi:GntP family gluconate:H+ symporter